MKIRSMNKSQRLHAALLKRSGAQIRSTATKMHKKSLPCAFLWLFFLAFQRRPIPFCKLRTRLVGTLAEIEYGGLRRRISEDIVVLKDEFAQLCIPVCAAGPHGFIGQTRRAGRGVGVKSRILEPAIARPKPATDGFVRISFASHRIRVRLFGSAPARKTCHREIE